MSFTVVIRGAAERDVTAAQDWYEKEAGLGADFYTEFSATIDTLANTPFIYSEVYRGVRRAILHRFPYLVWYRVDEHTVTVVACTHARTGPRKLGKKIS